MMVLTIFTGSYKYPLDTSKILFFGAKQKSFGATILHHASSVHSMWSFIRHHYVSPKVLHKSLARFQRGSLNMIRNQSSPVDPGHHQAQLEFYGLLGHDSTIVWFLVVYHILHMKITFWVIGGDKTSAWFWRAWNVRGLQPELISRRMSLCKRVALIFVAPSLRSVQIQVKLAGDSNQILRLPWKMTLQRQQILRLPRKMILMIDPRHIWNATHIARSNKRIHKRLILVIFETTLTIQTGLTHIIKYCACQENDSPTLLYRVLLLMFFVVAAAPLESWHS